MKNVFKLICYGLVVISVATLVSGCSLRRAPAKPKVFTIWAFDGEDAWKPILKELSKELSGYDVKYVQKSLNSSYENDALNSILSGAGPDVWAMPSDWVYRHKDKLAPMPDDQIKNLELDNNFVPLIKQMAYFDGKLYALSPSVDTLTLFYNEKMFEAALNEFNDAHDGSENVEARKTASRLLSSPPTTWNDFVETSRLITRKNGSNIVRAGTALGTVNNVNSSTDILYALMLQNGTKMTTDDYSQAAFNLPQNTSQGTSDLPGKRALSFFTSFSYPASPDYTWNSSMPNDIDAFTSGQVGMILADESLSNYLAQTKPDFVFKESPLPQIGTNDQDVVDLGSFTAFAVPALSQNTQLAWTFINRLSTDLASEYIGTLRIAGSAKKDNFTPSIQERANDGNPAITQSQTAKNWVKGRYPVDANNVMKTAIENIITGKQSTEVALDYAASGTTEFLRKSGW